jgi:[ribosomal protein S5]-alanine N-acetyltransferase
MIQTPELRTERLLLQTCTTAHAAPLLAFFKRNDAHFAPWDPPRAADYFTLGYWQRFCERTHEERKTKSAVRFVMVDPGSHELIGRINLTQITRAPFENASLGYQLDAAAQGKGLMREALVAVRDYAFKVEKLHRLQAAYMPENVRSAKVLQVLGFETIGVAKQYLFINGAWRDHVLSQSILN